MKLMVYSASRPGAIPVSDGYRDTNESMTYEVSNQDLHVSMDLQNLFRLGYERQVVARSYRRRDITARDNDHCKIQLNEEQEE